MRHGYIRVSTRGQNPDRQIMKLESYCDYLTIEYFSAAKTENREKFLELIENLTNGDEFVVWELDRAFRNAKDALHYEEYFREIGVDFTVLDFGFDTSTAKGKRDFHYQAADAEYQRKRISERTIEGLKATRLKGTELGRPNALTLEQIEEAWQLRFVRKMYLKDIAKKYDVMPWTITRNFKSRLDDNGKRIKQHDNPKTIENNQKRELKKSKAKQVALLIQQTIN